jgi:hypothetical protein
MNETEIFFFSSVPDSYVFIRIRILAISQRLSKFFLIHDITDKKKVNKGKLILLANTNEIFLRRLFLDFDELKIYWSEDSVNSQDNTRKTTTS